MITAQTMANAEYVVACVGLAAAAKMRIEQALKLSASRAVRYRKRDGAHVDVVLLGRGEDLAQTQQNYPYASLLRVETHPGGLALSRPGSTCRLSFPFLARYVLSALDSCMRAGRKPEKPSGARLLASVEGEGELLKIPEIEPKLAQYLLQIRPNFPGGTGALVVDDHADSAAKLATFLTGFGIRAHACDNAMNALKKIQKTHYQLLFVDAVMPVVDGFAFVRSALDVLADKPPYIVMSNHRTGMWFRQRAAAAGAVATLSKPVQAEALSHTISELFADSTHSNITPSIKA